MFDSRLGCSTISFRHQSLRRALETIADLGFGEVDLGSLPGVCDHVPLDLDGRDVRDVTDAVRASGLAVRSVNCDVGSLNDAATELSVSTHLDRLLQLAQAVGARALVLPNGAIDHSPVMDLDADLDRVAANLDYVLDCALRYDVEVWTESLHVYRLCCNAERAAALTSRLNLKIGIVMDFSHIVASGGDPTEFVDAWAPRITHVHIRDATRGMVDLDGVPVVDDPGNINLSVGYGDVDFGAGLAALRAAGYDGHYTLELETRDVTDDQRPSAAVAAGTLITDLLDTTAIRRHQETS